MHGASKQKTKQRWLRGALPGTCVRAAQFGHIGRAASGPKLRELMHNMKKTAKARRKNQAQSFIGMFWGQV